MIEVILANKRAIYEHQFENILSITIHLLQLLSNFRSQIGFVIIKIKFEIREIVF